MDQWPITRTKASFLPGADESHTKAVRPCAMLVRDLFRTSIQVVAHVLAQGKHSSHCRGCALDGTTRAERPTSTNSATPLVQ